MLIGTASDFLAFALASFAVEYSWEITPKRLWASAAAGSGVFDLIRGTRRVAAPTLACDWIQYGSSWTPLVSWTLTLAFVVVVR